MQRPRTRWLPLILLLLLAAAGCNRPAPTPPDRPPAVESTQTATATHTATATATITPSPTATPSPTPTPTATAQPIQISDAVRPPEASAPIPQDGAPCGLVDTLDFPVDPPLAEEAYLIQGFGRGGRPAGQHAGEDWGLLDRPNLGAPVYSIGHGRVTYAQPLGWGRDKGVIIVEHRFADGSRILSFYGHLEPSTVQVRAGDCVERGEEIARIGRPRTPPHLHFEMRSHMPDEPGPGYWPDPASAGWTGPSQFIWNNRMAASPGVVWSQRLDGALLSVPASAVSDAVLVTQNNGIQALDVADGTARWRVAVADGVAGAVLSADGSALYVLDQTGMLSALDLPVSAEGGQPVTRWQIALDAKEDVALMPLADGGVLVSAWEIVFHELDGKWELSGQRQMTAIAADGDITWERTRPSSLYWQPEDDRWTLAGSELVLAVPGNDARVWSIDREGPAQWTRAAGEQYTVNGDQIWGFDAGTVYQLQPGTRSVVEVASLPAASPGIEAILPLPDERLLLAYRDRSDRRLLLLDSDGALIWDRSFASLGAATPSLLLAGNQPLLLMQNATRAGTRVDLYTIDVAGESLTRIFSGGGPVASRPATAWSDGTDRVFLAIPDGSILALDIAAGG